VMALEQICMKTMTGRALCLWVGSSDTIAHVKDTLEMQHGIPSRIQRLVLRGKILQDDRSVSDFCIEADEVVKLVIRSDLGLANANGDQPSLVAESRRLDKEGGTTVVSSVLPPLRGARRPSKLQAYSKQGSLGNFRLDSILEAPIERYPRQTFRSSSLSNAHGTFGARSNRLGKEDAMTSSALCPLPPLQCGRAHRSRFSSRLHAATKAASAMALDLGLGPVESYCKHGEFDDVMPENFQSLRAGRVVKPSRHHSASQLLPPLPPIGQRFVSLQQAAF